MSKKSLSGGQRSRAKGGGFVPALCNVIGTLILLAVIAASLAITVPRFMGYGIYNIVSGSMEPEIPVGSVIYVEEVKPEDIKEKEIIAFQSGESIIAHRVMENKMVEGEFITKGDANAEEDMQPVAYGQLVGRVARHYPMLGVMMEIYTSKVGKAYVICFAACGAMFNVLAGRIRARKRQRAMQKARENSE